MHWISPDHLPRVDGSLDRYLFNPHGGVDGFLMADGMEVHVPPHLGAELRAAVQPGAAVSVFGVRPRGAEMISAVAIEAGPGTRIVDNGPPGDKHKAHGHDGKPEQCRPEQDAQGDGKPPRPSMEAEGTVQRVLHGPKGGARGALLQNGRIIRMPSHDAKEHGALLRPGAALAARGPGVSVDGAVVIEAKEVGATLAALQPVKPKPTREGGKPEGGKSHRGKPQGGKDHKGPKHA